MLHSKRCLNYYFILRIKITAQICYLFQIKNKILSFINHIKKSLTSKIYEVITLATFQGKKANLIDQKSLSFQKIIKIKQLSDKKLKTFF